MLLGLDVAVVVVFVVDVVVDVDVVVNFVVDVVVLSLVLVVVWILFLDFKNLQTYEQALKSLSSFDSDTMLLGLDVDVVVVIVVDVVVDVVDVDVVVLSLLLVVVWILSLDFKSLQTYDEQALKSLSSFASNTMLLGVGVVVEVVLLCNLEFKLLK